MSLPQERISQLLSGYLDDALTADDRAQVEQLLHSSVAVADELQQLRNLRGSLQDLSRSDSGRTLDRGFADRVLGAAVARAREEGLGDEHPLIRLAEQPSTSPVPVVSAGRSWVVAAALVGLAASLTLALFLLRPEVGPDQQSIAQSESSSLDAQSDPAPGGTRIDTDRETTDSMLAQTQPSSSHDSSLDVIVRSDHQRAETDVRPAGGTEAPSVAATETTASNAVDTAGAASGIPPLSAILVIEVRRSEQGRRDDALGRAMRAAEIAPAMRKEVTDQMAGFVADQVIQPTETQPTETQPSEELSVDVSVVYLELPGRQFDRFYQQLWIDEAGIESVRMSLAMNPPILRVLDAVRRDPTTVRHEETAYELYSRSGVVDQLAEEMQQLTYFTANRSSEASTLFGSGPDIQAQVLLLVR